ncbi:S8 family serine peptidase [Actinoplanes sp. M2I2]|uniref:S8 family serine peptidase n=1 Tax=Actinoplanes sp. M2I2 TaxID=1734444 RepID=UPI00201FEBE7|nr:S8 family serine peptidase [Actinoplanes sp. M2I2]
MATGPQLRRTVRSLVGAGMALLVAGAGLAAPGSAQAAPAAGSKDKVRPELAAQMAARGGGDFWIRFGARADLGAASQIKDWDQRGTAVAAALKKAAASSQTGVRAELDRDGATYQAFWGTNAIKVSKGSAAMVQSLAARPEIEGLYPAVKVEAPKVAEGTKEKVANAVEWGIANINADKVWAQDGITGEGVTVASIDSGVQFDHPALVGTYRGNNGDGTFTHDYNWFDAAGACNGAPCDSNGHGTHTMGTMAGSAEANQIGVAPGARWITANGCCPSDTALISSGQWMLEPTDATGANPDASKRPNIINNSWGTQTPSNDPFMEDVSLAWTASGIFGVFANGNSGPACQSSGAPGSLASNYSAGAYGIDNIIGDFSGRGAGQIGELKPNISAPGVNVRSSWPNGGYNSISGTSMAAPHLAGAIALLWSAAPALAGDVTATRALLDDAAVDAENSQCGGTTDDNNVFGEGRLDALKLIAEAPTGDAGTLAGKVTDAGTGTAIANATLTLTGAADRQLTTGTDGTYSTRLPAGDYQAAVAAYGYAGKTVPAAVTANQTTTTDVALTAVPTVSVGGAVTDGSGHGWPLYAKVTVAGPGGVSDYTTPSNGRYSFRLPAGATYKITVTSQYPGYQAVTKDVVVGTRNVTHNVAVPVSTDDCTTAPGYVNDASGEFQSFDGTSAPAGWTVVDNKGAGQSWKFTDDRGRGNKTGGEGGFAIIDSDRYGSGGAQDTSLVSPVLDLTGITEPVIRFDQEYRQYGAEKGDVDVSVDGGATWTTALQQTTNTPGPQRTTVAIPQAADKSQVQVRFHYYDASFAWWWEVDNVLVGELNCEPVDGGLVIGHVRDGNTSGYVNNATVADKNDPAVKVTTVATPDDTGLADGFFWLLSKPGSRTFDAKATGYSGDTGTVDVDADWVTPAAFELAAGRLEVTPASVSADVRMPDGTAGRKVTVTNTGTRPVEVKFGERDGGFDLLRADGSRTSLGEILGSPGAPAQRLTGNTSFAAKPGGKNAAAAVVKDAPQAEPWTNIADYPSVVMDNRVVSLDGKVYSIGGSSGETTYKSNFVYDPVAQAWSPIADLPEARSAMTVGVLDGQIIATGGWSETAPMATTWAYDPGADTWTRKADNPAPRSAAGQAVVDGKLYAVGGCTSADCLPMSNDVVRYDAAADAWETLPDYPKSLAFASCGGLDGVLYCSGGNDGSASQKAGYAFDPATGSWTAIADAPSDHWASSFATANGRLLVVGGSQGPGVTNAGFAYDPAADSWAALPNANAPRYRGAAACGFYKVGGSSGGFNPTKTSEVLPGLAECAENGDVSWMTLDRTEATVAPGKKVTVTVGLTAAVDQPGAYTGAVTVKTDTPYAVPAVGVTLNALPPKTWAKLMGTVTGAPCGGGSGTPLAGATVQVDSWASSHTFATDAGGAYAYWLDKRNNPLTLIAAKDGFKPQARTSKVSTAEPKVENFALQPVRC